MSYTEIDFVETVDGRFKLIEFRNVLSESAIAKKFGAAAHRVYFSGGPNYFEKKPGEIAICYHGRTHESVSCGTIMTAYEWDRFRIALRASSETLRAIQEAVERDKIKTIVI